MADGMCFDKYIDNPSGGNVFTNRNIYKAMYKAKFDKVLVREQGQIKVRVFRTEDANDTYFIYIKVPSEVITDFYYDVVIKLFTTENVKKTNANLRSYAVQFFSNDPAFVYTFAHSFHKNKLFIEELKIKMMHRALAEKASIRNPKDNVWYVKSLFFAYLTMERYSLFQRSMLNQHAEKYNKNELLRIITPADKKVADRQHEQELLDAKIRKEKEEAKKQRQQPSNLGIATRTAKKSPISGISKITKTVKNTGTIKTSKRITMTKPK